MFAYLMEHATKINYRGIKSSNRLANQPTHKHANSPTHTQISNHCNLQIFSGKLAMKLECFISLIKVDSLIQTK